MFQGQQLEEADQVDQHPMQSRSVTELCDLVLSTNDSERQQAVVGALAILIGAIARQQKSDTLRAAFREIAQTCSVTDTKKILKAAKTGLTLEQAEWLNSQLASIAQGELRPDNDSNS